MTFCEKDYWEKRLEEKYDLSGVGWVTLGRHFNKWAYWAKRWIFNRIIKDMPLASFDSAILDIGSGTGFYIDRWLEVGGQSIVGCDLTNIAVANLKDRYPNLKIFQADITSPLAELPFHTISFDIISCFDVLCHITKEDNFEEAIFNISKLLTPGGYLIITDYFLHKSTRMKLEHVTFRTLTDYQKVLTANGFFIEKRYPASVLCFPPIDLPSRTISFLWYALTAPVRIFKPLGYIYGLFFSISDIMLTKIIKEGPGLEVMVCRRGKSTHDFLTELVI